MALGRLVVGVQGLSAQLLAVPFVARLLPGHNLRVRLALILSSAALAVVLVMTALVSLAVERGVETSIGQSVSQVAYQISDKLDREMSARARELGMVAGLRQMRDPGAPPAEKRELLNRLQASFPEYAWLGIVDLDGTVLTATDGVLEGENVADRSWLSAGLQGPAVGDVTDDPQLATLVPSDGASDVTRFVAVAVPLSDAGGNGWGVLAGQLGAPWVRSIQASVTESGDGLRDAVYIADRDGDVILAPTGNVAAGSVATLESVQAAHAGQRGYRLERWPDGVTYLTGFAPGRGVSGAPGSAWTVLVRQDPEAATLPARQLRQQILTVGLGAALLLAALGWFLAVRITGPLRAIAAAASRIERGERGASMPKLAGDDELAEVSASLDSLVESLRTRERDLQRLAAMHEQRVRERTADLEEANRLLEQFSSTDALTGVANRGHFDKTLDREWRTLARSQEPLSLIMVDIDHFKGYNDTYGHQQGDECLKQVAGALYHTAMRAGDLVARYVGSSRVDLQACKLEYSIVSPK